MDYKLIYLLLLFLSLLVSSNCLRNNTECLINREVNINLNKYTDRILENIQKQIISEGMDPMKLKDFSVNAIVASLAIKQGWLQELSTIKRINDVQLEYNSDCRNVSYTLPIGFDTLLVIFKYISRVFVVVSYQGHIDIKVSNVSLHLRFGFDFDKFVVNLDTLDLVNAGNIKVTFTGHGLTDWMRNILSNFFTKALHGFIVDGVQYFVRKGAEDVAHKINEILSHYKSHS